MVDNGTSDAPTSLAALEFDGIALPVYDLEEFNAADIDRVKSFTTNFGRWQVPPEVAAALAMRPDSRASIEWIHDTGELVLLGGVPSVAEVAVEVPPSVGYSAGDVPAFIGGLAAGVERDAAGHVRELFKSEVMPRGSRVALLAHVRHGPKVHELLWGWHHEHNEPDGWQWLLDRLARLEGDDTDHLG